MHEIIQLNYSLLISISSHTKYLNGNSIKNMLISSVRHLNVQVHIGPWTMNQWCGPKIQSSHRQGPRPKPTNSYQRGLSVVRTLRKRIAYALLTGCSGNHFRALCTCSVTLPGHIAIYVPDRTIGNSAAEHINWSGNHFQNHSYLKTHLSPLTLDPSLH